MLDLSKSFIENTIIGHASAEDIESFIDSWHFSRAEKALPEYLGLSEAEYDTFCNAKPSDRYRVVQSIIEKYKAMKDILEPDKSASVDPQSRPIIKTNR